MSSSTLKIILIVGAIATITLGGAFLWQSPKTVQPQPFLQVHMGNSFAFEYPSNYQINTDRLGITTVSGAQGKIMIGNFEPAAGPDLAEDGSPAKWEQSPKDIQYHGEDGAVASALFYAEEDEKTRQELLAIQNSITLFLTKKGVLKAHLEDAEAAILMMDDGTELFLIDQSGNLIFPPFIGKRVEVKGLMEDYDFHVMGIKE